MNDHIHLFATEAEFLSAYTNDYVEPWVSFTMETSGLSYNKGQTPPHDYSQDYLTLVMLTSGSIEKYDDTIEFSVDGGETWATELNDLQEGDSVLIRGYYTEGQSSCPWGMVGSCNAQGNILSLYDADNFRTRTSLDEYTDSLGGVFYGVDLFSAENLVLPLTALTPGCYSYMFASCNNLTAAPELPATTLAYQCYNSMFMNCTSLATAPELPATTLARNCYSLMFSNCSSLTTAPELPATTLTDNCYYSMFSGCTNLNYVKCLATDISANDCTYDWVNGVSSTGTFVKDASMTDWEDGNYGIPEGWTVQDA